MIVYYNHQDRLSYIHRYIIHSYPGTWVLSNVPGLLRWKVRLNNAGLATNSPVLRWYDEDRVLVSECVSLFTLSACSTPTARVPSWMGWDCRGASRDEEGNKNYTIDTWLTITAGFFHPRLGTIFTARRGFPRQGNIHIYFSFFVIHRYLTSIPKVWVSTNTHNPNHEPTSHAPDPDPTEELIAAVCKVVADSRCLVSR